MRLNSLLLLLSSLVLFTSCDNHKSNEQEKVLKEEVKKVPYFFKIDFPENIQTKSPTEEILNWKKKVLKPRKTVNESILFYPVNIDLGFAGEIKKGKVYRSFKNPDLYFVWPHPVGWSWIVLDLNKKQIWIGDDFDVCQEDQTTSILLTNKWEKRPMLGSSLAEYDPNFHPYEFSDRTVRWTWGDIESYLKDKINK